MLFGCSASEWISVDRSTYELMLGVQCADLNHMSIVGPVVAIEIDFALRLEKKLGDRLALDSCCQLCTLCYAIMLPARKSAFRAGFWPDCYRERTEIGPPAGRRPAEGRPGCFPGSSPAKFRPGRPISGSEAVLRNIE